VERRLPALRVEQRAHSEAKSGAADGRPLKSLQLQPDEAAGAELLNPGNSKSFVTFGVTRRNLLQAIGLGTAGFWAGLRWLLALKGPIWHGSEAFLLSQEWNKLPPPLTPVFDCLKVGRPQKVGAALDQCSGGDFE
jgi:hypothetical protein